MRRRHHLPTHELLHYFFCPYNLPHSSCISWHNHTSSKFWFRTSLVLSACIAGIHFFLWMEVTVHWWRQMNQPKTVIYTIQWTCPKISRNAAILSSKRCSVLVALLSNLITNKRRCPIMFSLWAGATFGGVLLQVKSLPWETFVFSSVLLHVSECSTSVFSRCLWSPVSATSYRQSISSSRSSSTASSSSSEPLWPISRPLCLSSSLSTLSETRRLIS